MTEDEYSRIENGKLEGQAIFFMKSRKPNPDGTIGHIARPGTQEWDAWQRYFRINGMTRQLAFMNGRGPAGYMVPHADPGVFDPAFRHRIGGLAAAKSASA